MKKKVNAKKRTFFLEMPNIFIINLKRFEYDIEIQNRKKLNDYLEFPLELDMEKYSAEYNLKGKTDKFKFNE